MSTPPATTPPAQRQRTLGLTGEFLRRIEVLSIHAQQRLSRGGIVNRSGAVPGGRVEFLEHRGYVEGDDLRDVDWNVYARTGEPFVKRFGAEREKDVTILLDLSPSMAAVATKEIRACRLAAALAHIALAAGDRISLGILDPTRAPLTRKGASAAKDLVDFVERQPLTTAVDWSGYFTAWGEHSHRAGVMLLVSDFWATDILPALAPLGRARQEVTLLHVLTPAERIPPLGGNVRLEDAETGEETSLRIGEPERATYTAAAEAHIHALATGANRAGMRHLLCMSDIPFEALLLNVLKQGSLRR